MIMNDFSTPATTSLSTEILKKYFNVQNSRTASIFSLLSAVLVSMQHETSTGQTHYWIPIKTHLNFSNAPQHYWDHIVATDICGHIHQYNRQPHVQAPHFPPWCPTSNVLPRLQLCIGISLITSRSFTAIITEEFDFQPKRRPYSKAAVKIILSPSCAIFEWNCKAWSSPQVAAACSMYKWPTDNKYWELSNYSSL